MQAIKFNVSKIKHQAKIAKINSSRVCAYMYNQLLYVHDACMKHVVQLFTAMLLMTIDQRHVMRYVMRYVLRYGMRYGMRYVMCYVMHYVMRSIYNISDFSLIIAGISCQGARSWLNLTG